MFLFFMKHSDLLTAKATFEINNFLLFLKAVQELDNSLYVKRNFCYLIMNLNKLI